MEYSTTADVEAGIATEYCGRWWPVWSSWGFIGYKVNRRGGERARIQRIFAKVTGAFSAFFLAFLLLIELPREMRFTSFARLLCCAL